MERVLIMPIDQVGLSMGVHGTKRDPGKLQLRPRIPHHTQQMNFPTCHLASPGRAGVVRGRARPAGALLLRNLHARIACVEFCNRGLERHKPNARRQSAAAAAADGRRRRARPFGGARGGEGGGALRRKGARGASAAPDRAGLGRWVALEGGAVTPVVG